MNEYSIFDAHCDTLCRIVDSGGSIKENDYNFDIKKTNIYKNYIQVFACFISDKYKTSPMDRFNALLKCYNSQDFNGIAPVLSVENGELIKTIADVEYLYNCGVRCISLTWNGTNHLAGGCDSEIDELTSFGKEVVGKMNELGICVDVSHLNDKSFYQVVNISKKPVIASHSNSRAICGVKRNITDNMFEVIRDSGGCVGINLYPYFVTGKNKCKISDVISHIEHFIRLDGAGALGIGSDFDGTENCLPDGICDCSDLFKLFEYMKKLGYSKDIIDNIAHSNFERVFKEVI